MGISLQTKQEEQASSQFLLLNRFMRQRFHGGVFHDGVEELRMKLQLLLEMAVENLEDRRRSQEPIQVFAFNVVGSLALFTHECSCSKQLRCKYFD